MRSWFTFPNPVNEKAARTVASGAVLLSLAFVITRTTWLLVPLAYGFVARVLAGPRFSPLGRFAVHVAAPRLGVEKNVPGPPKRFAQAIGATLSVAALVSAFVFSNTLVAVVLVAMIAVAAFLEAAFGFCLGCVIFARLMRWGVIPADVCESCNDITGRLAARSASLASTS